MDFYSLSLSFFFFFSDVKLHSRSDGGWQIDNVVSRKSTFLFISNLPIFTPTTNNARKEKERNKRLLLSVSLPPFQSCKAGNGKRHSGNNIRTIISSNTHKSYASLYWCVNQISLFFFIQTATFCLKDTIVYSTLCFCQSKACHSIVSMQFRAYLTADKLAVVH